MTAVFDTPRSDRKFRAALACRAPDMGTKAQNATGPTRGRALVYSVELHKRR